MDRKEIRGLLERYRQGEATLEESVEALARLPYENIGFAQIGQFFSGCCRRARRA